MLKRIKPEDSRIRSAMRKVRRIQKRQLEGIELTEWEEEFLASLGDRLDRFGSAFLDPDKGSWQDPLSFRQSFKVSEIDKERRHDDDKNADGKKRSAKGGGFKKPAKPLQRKTPLRPRKP